MDSVGGFKTDNAVFQSKQREIPALADKMARLELSALLTDDDASGSDEFTAKALDSQTLGIGISSVF